MVEGALADASRGQVDDAIQANIVVRVGDEAQVGDDVLHFLPLVELHPADYLIWHAVAQASLFQRARLCVDAVHHGDVAQRGAFLLATYDRFLIARQTLYLPDDELRLFFLVVSLRDDDGDAGAVARPEVLLHALRVGGDEAAGGVEYRLRGAVILLQRDELRLRVVVLEAEDVADVGVAPGVDGLVGVAHDADVQVVARHLPGDGVLRHIRVLELVNHEVDIAFLILLRHVGHALEELVGLEEQVVEVQGGALA